MGLDDCIEIVTHTPCGCPTTAVGHGDVESQWSAGWTDGLLFTAFLLQDELLNLLIFCRQQLDTKMERLRERLKTMSQQARL